MNEPDNTILISASNFGVTPVREAEKELEENGKLRKENNFKKLF